MVTQSVTMETPAHVRTVCTGPFLLLLKGLGTRLSYIQHRIFDSLLMVPVCCKPKLNTAKTWSRNAISLGALVVLISWCPLLYNLRHSKSIHCFSSPLSPKIDAGGQATGNGRLITSLMGNGRQTISSAVQKIKAVYFYIVLVLMVRAEIKGGGGGRGGDEKNN